jgi:hypothetical protein
MRGSLQHIYPSAASARKSSIRSSLPIGLFIFMDAAGQVSRKPEVAANTLIDDNRNLLMHSIVVDAALPNHTRRSRADPGSF